MEIKLSIIIVSWNVCEDVLSCIQSIQENPSSYSHEIILVDNNSADETVKAVGETFPDALVIKNNDNLGFAAANNIGIQKAQGQFLLILNPDTFVLPNALDLLIDFMEAHTDVGVCGPKILNPDHTLQDSVRSLPAFGAIFHRFTILKYFKFLRKAYNKNMLRDFDYDSTGDVDQLIGAAMMIRKSLMDELGGFDERFFMYYEEVDLCRRVQEKGLHNVFYPESKIVHTGGQSSGQIRAKSRFMVLRSLLLYLRKYYVGFSNWGLIILFIIGVGLRQLFEGFYYLVTALFSCFNRRRFRRNLKRSRIGFEFILKYYWRLLLK